MGVDGNALQLVSPESGLPEYRKGILSEAAESADILLEGRDE